MAKDDDTLPPRGYTTTDVNTVVPERKSFRHRHRWKFCLLGIVLVPLLLFALWTATTLSWSYSDGQRTGYLRKFSQKGWLCKTWEGELTMAPTQGMVPEKFYFTVRDDAVVRKLQAMEGNRVALAYEQHKFIPFSCFGETEYFVTDVKPVGPQP